MQACRPRNESVIQGCMTGAVQGTGMAVGELWRRTVEGDTAHFECLHIAVPDDVLLPAGMPGQSTDGKKHPLSKQVWRVLGAACARVGLACVGGLGVAEVMTSC
jgi:hypothetical protein